MDKQIYLYLDWDLTQHVVTTVNMKPFDDFHTFTHRHGPNAKSQVATEDKMVVNVSGSILQAKLPTAYCTVYTPIATQYKNITTAVWVCPTQLY